MKVKDMQELGDQLDDAFAAVIEGAITDSVDVVAAEVDRHQEAVLAAEREIAEARRTRAAAIDVIEAKRAKATALYRITMERFASDEATVVEAMHRRVATAEKLAAISRAALRAVQP